MVCGLCRHCLAGRRHLCAHSIGLGVGRDGAFAEYIALPMTNVWHHWSGFDGVGEPSKLRRGVFLGRCFLLGASGTT